MEERLDWGGSRQTKGLKVLPQGEVSSSLGFSFRPVGD